MTGILRWINTILKHLPIILFIVYYGSTTMFPHIHYLENDVVIIHSHPFKKEAGQDPVRHMHSTAELLLIQQLTNFLSTPVFAFTVLLILKTVIRYLGSCPDASSLIVSPCVSAKRLRAPPVLSVIP